MVGTTIGQYKVVERLGEGGMGVVYKARDTKLDRTVAIKVLPPELVADAGRNARFIQEAKAASALNHPNIVTIHDIVSHQAGECIVMEYIEGRPLALLIAQKEMRLSEILRIAAQTADAVAAAHTAGIIHRDLKPANVMVTGSGLVKVVDFGLAKLVSGPGGPVGVTMTMPRTDQGTVVGTPGYMSPEQVRGQELDRRSDIFNFGLVLYEMLAGARAFQGDTTADVASAILKESPPDLPDTVPAALRQIVAVCLEKNPVNRFESARDLGHALRAISAGTSLTGALPKVEGMESKDVWMRRWPLALAAVASVAAIALALLYLFRRPEALDLSTYKFTPFATEAALESNAAWSPDGKSIAYLKRIDRNFQLMVRSLGAPLPIQLTNDARIVGLPFWSPGGDRVYYISLESNDGKLRSVGVAGGESQLITPSVYLAAALSPDGKTLAFWSLTEEKGRRTGSLWISSPPGSTPRKYQPAPFELPGPRSPIFVRFSPDGSKIGLADILDVGEGHFWLLDWPDGAGSKQRRLFSDLAIPWTPYFDWFPDSRHVVMAFGGGLWFGDTTTSELRRVTAIENSEHLLPSVSPDGRRIAFTARTDDYDILEIPLDGSRPKPFIATARKEFSPSWSRAGDRMAYISDKSGAEEIWLRSASGDWERPVVTQDDFSGGPSPTRFSCAALSPDGSKVAYSGIYVSSTSGGKPMRAFPGDHPNWSPDGKALVFSAFTDRPRWAVARIGSQEPPVYFSDVTKGRPMWSPDGRWLAGEYGTNELIVVSPDGKISRKLPCPVNTDREDFVLVWSADSSTLYLASSQFENARLFAVDTKTGKATQVSDLGPDVKFGFYLSGGLTACLSADGKSLFSTVRVEKADLWILEGFPRPGRLP